MPKSGAAKGPDIGQFLLGDVPALIREMQIGAQVKRLRKLQEIPPKISALDFNPSDVFSFATAWSGRASN